MANSFFLLRRLFNPYRRALPDCPLHLRFRAGRALRYGLMPLQKSGIGKSVCRDPLLAAVIGLKHLAVGTGLLAIPEGAFKSLLRTVPVKRLILAPAGSTHSAGR